MPLRDAINRPVRTRPCAVAGGFYPSDADTLRHDLTKYLDEAGADPGEAHEPGDKPVRALIGPHAGYIYSAPIAASAYRCVSRLKGRVERVVLIGPAHYVPFSGLGCCGATAFETPLGEVPVDTDAVDQLLEHENVILHDEAHAPEHGLEVHLPFLIHTLGGDGGAGFALVPLLFGSVSYEDTAEVLGPFFDDPTTLVVVSSDLSHYHDYDTARAMDRQTADAIVAGRGDAVAPDRACGHTAVRALLRCCQVRGLQVTEVDLRNSGDTAGPRDRVVGYGAFVIRQQPMTPTALNPDERATLIDIARTSISHGLTQGRALTVDPARFSGGLTEPRASFVTLKIGDQLRGCIGRLEPDGPLVCGVARNAYAAAFHDPRFEPMTEPESRELSIHISVLTPPQLMTFDNEADLLGQLRPGVDGLVLEAGRCRGTFLPAVWETLPDPVKFLAQLKVKAGLHPDAWPSDARVLRYTCESVA